MMKDNTYVLNKNLYTQVREDWPLYSDEDRKTLRKLVRVFCVMGVGRGS